MAATKNTKLLLRITASTIPTAGRMLIKMFATALWPLVDVQIAPHDLHAYRTENIFFSFNDFSLQLGHFLIFIPLYSTAYNARLTSAQTGEAFVVKCSAAKPTKDAQVWASA